MFYRTVWGCRFQFWSHEVLVYWTFKKSQNPENMCKMKCMAAPLLIMWVVILSGFWELCNSVDLHNSWVRHPAHSCFVRICASAGCQHWWLFAWTRLNFQIHYNYVFISFCIEYRLMPLDNYWMFFSSCAGNFFMDYSLIFINMWELKSVVVHVAANLTKYNLYEICCRSRYTDIT